MSVTRYYECPKHRYGTNVYEFFTEHLENEHESSAKEVTSSEYRGNFLKIAGLRQGIIRVWWKRKQWGFGVDKYGRIRGIVKTLGLKSGEKLSYISLNSAIYLEKAAPRKKSMR